MKALFAAGIPRSIHPQSLYQYVVFGNVEFPNDKRQTFFQGIYRLPNHHYLLIKDGKVQENAYWELETAEEEWDEHKAIEHFRSLFFESIQRRMRSDVPVGSSLSGGLDSSSIACSIHHLYPNQSYHTFSGVFPGFSKDESPFIQTVIQHTGFYSHTVSPTAEEIAQLFQTVFYHQEEPFGSMSICLQYCVFQLARQNHVIVLLDGQGGDEALAGYHAYYYTYLAELLRKNLFQFCKARKAIETLHNQRLELRPGFYFRSLLPEVWGYSAHLRRKSLPPTHPYFKGLNPDIVQSHQNQKSFYPLRPSLKALLRWNLVHKGLHELLRYADRNSMAHSLEVRLPFLYHKLVEFVMRLPTHFILREGWTKWILRKAMDGILPPSIQWRKDKIGYEPHHNEWLKHPTLQTLIQEARSYLQQEKLITQIFPDTEWSHLNLYLLLTCWKQDNALQTRVT